jgi:hypothetical protein
MAAVDGEDRAGHEGRCVGGEKRDRVGDFLGAGITAEGMGRVDVG